MNGSIRWVRFLITFGAAAGYQISYAVYVFRLQPATSARTSRARGVIS